MESKRQQKFSRLIQKELSEIFQREMQHKFGKTFITVTSVRMTADLSLARVYLSFMLAPNTTEVMKQVEDYHSEIRRHLGLRIGKQVRHVPDLQFFQDDSAEYSSNIDKILSGLDIPPADDEGKGDNGSEDKK
ncbi:30S ribosome-binding factor RbfA [Roseivirga sp. BDSF3-8]|uniref:30S ribosome-binding factor RbfA n=1 Tax=Roseivirga sp. BDSF3-8 TaxID=3241598 RepID=UPI00353247EC